MASKLKKFLLKDIWTARTSSMPKPQAFFTTVLRIAVLSARRFVESKRQLRASALTFYTLLSVVPVFALLFGIAKGYGFELVLQDKLRASLVGHEEVANKIIAFASSLLDSAKGGMIAGIGVLILLWTAIRLLSNIEGVLNEVWEARQGRSFFRKASDYLSIALVCPFLIVVSGSATVFVASQATGLAHALPFSSALNLALGIALKTLPLFFVWAVFSFLYVFMPNAKVKLFPAIVGGVVAGTLYYACQEVYVFTQIGVARYNAIYGSFAALPLFLIWLQISWTIALFGAEISYAVQNVSDYELDPADKGFSQARRRVHTLELARQIALDFEAGRAPRTCDQLAKQLDLPVRAAGRILSDLVAAGVAAVVLRSDGARAYQPAMPPERMTPAKVLFCVDSIGENGLTLVGKVAMTSEALRKCMESSYLNKPLAKI